MKCKVCKQPVLGRADKIFCTIDCKNQYHKSMRTRTRKVAKEISSYLDRNYVILTELIGNAQKQKKVYRNLLETKKFRFKYHTHFHINSKKKMFHYIYDLGWMEFSDDEVLIVRKKLDPKRM